MKLSVRVTAAVIPILFLVGSGAVSSAEKFQSGVPYYFESFDPAMKPWDPGQDLNFEEVFKNFSNYSGGAAIKRSEVEVDILGRSWRGSERDCRPACAE